MTDKVVVTFPVDEEQKNIITRGLEDLARVIFAAGKSDVDRIGLMAAADVVLCKSFSLEEISPGERAAIDRVRLIQLWFAGVDKVPFESIPPQTAVAGNVGAFAEPIAEHVLAMALALAKSLFVKHRKLANGLFDRSGYNRTLKGGICGIIGLGGNGKAIAELMGAVGMRVWGINRRGATDAAVEFAGSTTDLKKVLSMSDVVVVTTPLTLATRNLIGADELGWMKPDALLINVGRGAVINEKALYKHLCTHPRFGAGIDTWWSEPAGNDSFTPAYPFLDLPNVIGSPHIADVVPGTTATATLLAVDNVKNFLLGNPIRGLADPEDYRRADSC